jgi:hypothetical protein
MDSSFTFPIPPSFTKEQLDKALSTGDYRPVLFEWYKYTGIISNFIASILPNSEGFRELPKVHYAVLIGLLNRCSRLVLANIALSHKGLYGETFQIIERCIFESSTKVIWLCLKNNEDSYNRFLADGLKSDIELINCINTNINGRGGSTQVIEKRMMSSVNDVIEKSGLTVDQIKSCKKLPTLNEMLDDIEKNEAHLLYVVNQKIGSHSTHGTWTNLVKYYLVFEENEFHLRDHNVEVHGIQYLSSSFYVLNAIIAYINYVFIDEGIRDSISSIFIEIQKELQKIYENTRENDFSFIE